MVVNTRGGVVASLPGRIFGIHQLISRGWSEEELVIIFLEYGVVTLINTIGLISDRG